MRTAALVVALVTLSCRWCACVPLRPGVKSLAVGEMMESYPSFAEDQMTDMLDEAQDEYLATLQDMDYIREFALDLAEDPETPETASWTSSLEWKQLARQSLDETWLEPMDMSAADPPSCEVADMCEEYERELEAKRAPPEPQPTGAVHRQWVADPVVRMLSTDRDGAPPAPDPVVQWDAAIDRRRQGAGRPDGPARPPPADEYRDPVVRMLRADRGRTPPSAADPARAPVDEYRDVVREMMMDRRAAETAPAVEKAPRWVADPVVRMLKANGDAKPAGAPVKIPRAPVVPVRSKPATGRPGRVPGEPNKPVLAENVRNVVYNLIETRAEMYLNERRNAMWAAYVATR